MDLVERYGPENGQALWEFACGGVELIRTAITDHRIECDYQEQDALFVATSRSGTKTVAQEHAYRQAAHRASTRIARTRMSDVLGGKDFFGALRFGQTFGIDAFRFCHGLRDHLVDQGVKIFEHSRVTGIRENRLELETGAIRAGEIVVCGDRCLPALQLAQTEIYHVQTFLGITFPLSKSDTDRMFPAGPCMVWDTDLTYTYFRLTGESRLLIGGGTLLTTYARHERHAPETAARRFTHYLARHFPKLEVRFDACWPGLIGITKDFTPVVGRHPTVRSVHFAGGAAGLPWAAALGKYLAEKLVGNRADLDSLLAVDRKFPVRAGVQRIIGKPPAFALSHGILKFG
jgi:gamma-glutamylputrescine oxidase